MAKNTTYDIIKAFEAIENELIASMIRNMRDHKLEEIDEKKQWTMWQVEQLKSLEQYRRNNQERFGKEFKQINDNIELLIRLAKDEGEMEQEIEILKAIKKGFKARKVTQGASGEFFKLNERKLDALIKATVKDMQKAETAVLRMADDQYRKIIYNAQVYANTGAGTYEKAVDMATKDFIVAGLNCVEYANGARHTLKDYADMAIRTAAKRAYLQGEGTKRQEWGISTVIVNKRGNPCPKCLPFCGKVLIDDVWSDGSSDGISPVTGLKYPLMSKAVAAGLYHPRCKDVHTTYFEGVNTSPDDKYTRDELDHIAENYQKEQKQQYAKRQAEKFGRLEKYSLDEDNRKLYKNKAEQWERLRNGQRVIRKHKDRTGNQQDILNASTLEEVNTLASEKLGVKVDFQNCSVEYAKEQITFYEKLASEYEQGIKVTSLDTSKMFGKDAAAETFISPDYKIATISFSGKNVKQTSLDRLNSYTVKVDDKNVNISDLAHEVAHTITASKSGRDEDFWKEIRSIKNRYNRALTKIDKENIVEKTLSYEDAITRKKEIFISQYANKSLDEFMAEAFTDAKLSTNPSPYSKEVLEVIDKYYRKKPLVNSGVSGIINMEIDELTPCLRRLRDNQIVDTGVFKISPTKEEFTDWEFDWTVPEKNGYSVYEIKAEGDYRTQGMVALKKDKSNYAIHVDIVEAAPFNSPHNKNFVKKEYSGVGGHLFAEAVKQSYEAGFDGAVFFTAKTDLIEYYQKELGAVLVNPRQRTMFIDEEAAKKLYERYYGGK